MLIRLSGRPSLRYAELALFLFVVLSAGLYGAVRGGHAETLLAALHQAGDTVASAVGFRVEYVEIRGAGHVAHADLVRQAGITERTSLLLLDVEHVRAELKRMPWIAEATVRKLYPGRLDIRVEEHTPFARWQRDGRLHLIARGGKVLESDIGLQRADLPLVVGVGAESHAVAFLNLVDRFPTIRAELRAGVLVAERRWNLRLNNGIDVRLPEEDPALALERLVALDREKRILSRDVTMIDLRIPDKVVVTLSDAAAEARAARGGASRRGGVDS